MIAAIPWPVWFVAAFLGWLVTVIIDWDTDFFAKIFAAICTCVLFVIAIVRLVHWAWVG